jgi:hypothetical protein
MYLTRNTCITQTWIFAILILKLFYPSVGHSQDVVLAWDRPDDSRVTGYKIFYGLADKNFKSTPKQIIHSVEDTSCDIYNLKEGRTYGFAAKSMDGKGNESEFSEVIYYDVPGIPDDEPDNPDDEPDPNDDNKSGGGGGGCFINMAKKIN